MAKAVMVQGTGSSVGKSLLVAGLCRVFTRMGFRVRPFKPQNMSNNSSVAADGGEIGRAQALQAIACQTEPVTDMNPVLLKPETETGAQVVLRGRRVAAMRAKDYSIFKPRLAAEVHRSFTRLAKNADIVIAEGAGSPAEINLRSGDIANMGFARRAEIPVIVVGDIDRGGVIAQLAGTKSVIDKDDDALVRGFAVNKFRGDKSLFDDGYRLIQQLTGWKGLGVVPWFDEAQLLPSEDAMDLLERRGGDGTFKVACLALSRLANFDDLDPLRAEPGVTLDILAPGSALPSDVDLVIIPGSKSTRGDLKFMRDQGWDIDVLAHARRGGGVLGICGGYQMLGRRIADQAGIEGPAGTSQGLGLLNVDTEMEPEKQVRRTTGRLSPDGEKFEAYEIHLGRTEGPDRERAFAYVERGNEIFSEGAVSADGRIFGTYLHGLFSTGSFRRAFLERLGGKGSEFGYGQKIDQALDALADHLETHMELPAILEMMAEPRLSEDIDTRNGSNQFSFE